MSEAAETLGQRLKAAREQKGLSLHKAADDLRLDGWVVEALESGDYARIGPAVYAKGHLKRYAGLLGLPAAEILEGYRAQAAPPPAVAPAAAAAPATLRVTAAAGVGSRLPWLPIAGLGVAALVVAGVMWWAPWRPRGAALPLARSMPTDAAATPASAAVPVIDAEPRSAGPTILAASGGPALAASPGAAAAPHGAETLSGSGRARLRLSFSADSWVDVHDAAGQLIYAGNGHANSVRTIAGRAPLRVTLKSASGVQLEINNQAVAIGPQFVVGDVAHFEAGADGVLRQGAQPRVAMPLPRPRG